MNRNLENTADSVKAIEEAATMLATEIRRCNVDAKTLSMCRALIRQINTLKENVRLLELDASIVDVIRASVESRGTSAK